MSGREKVTKSNDAEGVEREREERSTKTVAMRRQPMTKGFYREAASQDKSKVQLGNNSIEREKEGICTQRVSRVSIFRL